MNVANLSIIIPTLGRAHVLMPLADNIAQATPQGRCRTVWVLDHADKDSRTVLYDIRKTHPDQYVVWCDGTCPVKTNAGWHEFPNEFVLPTADDVVFHDGWWEAAAAAFEDPGVHVVGTRDLSPLTTDGSHTTMPIIRGSYINDPGCVWREPGRIFHEGYHHGWIETEVWQLARARGVAKWVPESVIEHLHPDWGTRPLDTTDLKGNMVGKGDDYNLFERRRAEWAIQLAA